MVCLYILIWFGIFMRNLRYKAYTNKQRCLYWMQIHIIVQHSVRMWMWMWICMWIRMTNTGHYYVCSHNANNGATLDFGCWAPPKPPPKQIIAFIFITQNFSIKSDKNQNGCGKDAKTTLNFVLFSFHFFCCLVRSYFYFFRSVINKPTEQHVAYQWAERLWMLII